MELRPSNRRVKAKRYDAEMQGPENISVAGRSYVDDGESRMGFDVAISGAIFGGVAAGLTKLGGGEE